MSRTKSNPGEAAPRAGDSIAASTPRAGGADRHGGKRRSAASVRLQICANVFARSRIHFDPGDRRVGRESATDSAEAPATDDAGDGASDARSARPPSRDEPITIH